MKKLVVLLMFVFAGSIYSFANSKDEAKEINTSQFMELVMDFNANPDSWVHKGDLPVIIDFHAVWCGPCKTLSPILEKIAKEYKGKINVYKIDVDKEPIVAKEMGIKAMPTILFSPMEGKPKINVGLMSESEIRKIVDEFLLKK